jgi:hypothetical protein
MLKDVSKSSIVLDREVEEEKIREPAVRASGARYAAGRPGKKTNKEYYRPEGSARLAFGNAPSTSGS